MTQKDIDLALVPTPKLYSEIGKRRAALVSPANRYKGGKGRKACVCGDCPACKKRSKIVSQRVDI
jgi:7-cyano-7-deazaguanine synthase in queuosine biosynthesis